MQTIKKALFALVVLALFSVFLINVGSMPLVTNFAREVIGEEVGDSIEDFGNTSKDVVEGNYQSNTDWDAIFSREEAEAVIDGTQTTPNERTPKYTRDAFGTAWADVDGNGCGTRDDVLARDLTNVAKDGNCKVISGTLADPYTGGSIDFIRGGESINGVDAEHLLPLSYAWKNGAWKWTDEERLLLANDPEFIIAADPSNNRARGDKGPSEWMPPNSGYHCTFAVKMTAGVVKYNLTIPEADKTALKEALATCE